eukprot:6195414-Pleurochrysis_carterae.AAC.1
MAIEVLLKGRGGGRCAHQTEESTGASGGRQHEQRQGLPWRGRVLDSTKSATCLESSNEPHARVKV